MVSVMATKCRDPNSFSFDVFSLDIPLFLAPELCHRLWIPESKKGDRREHLSFL